MKMKKKKVVTILLASMMITTLMSGAVKAQEKKYITNPSFENEINKDDIQLYKAERSSDKAYDGTYSIKVGNKKPDDPLEVPIWSYNYGKGSVNVIIRNIEPNTTYKVKARFFNETGVKMSTGVLDIEGKHTTSPWKLASKILTNQKKSTDWQTNEMTITTGPRTNEIYAFAYMEWTGSDIGAGVFYIDDFEIEKVETKVVTETTSIEYTVPSSEEFPLTIPAIQKFEKAKSSDTFQVNTEKQLFSTDAFSKAKTQYLAKCMVEKGIIEDYEIQVVTDMNKAKGIVLFKEPIAYTLPNTVAKSKVDAYQIDISTQKVIVHSDNIEGIQNGSMTLLQALTQRNNLPSGMVQDYSDQEIRGLQVDSGRRYYSISWLKDQIDQMVYYKQNKLQLRLKDNEGIRYDSKIAPQIVDRKGGFWTQAEVNELVNYANQFNIEVIPEIDFPGHAEQEASYHADWGLAESKKALDFSKDEVREYMISIYKEAADFFHAKTIHIGGDEFFQSGYTTTGKKILTDWAKAQTGINTATDKDAIKIFFNEAADEMFKKDLKVLLWNDNVFDLGGAVPLDNRIIVDFWAGAMYGSILASDTANAGYSVMSSSSSNYHDLWPQEDSSGKLDRPLPKNLYEQFTRYNYSKASYSYKDDEILTKNLDKSLGQVFPIWDDAHGYVPEYILTRTLFPRYGGFALKTWGADYSREVNYAEFERLMYVLGSPRADMMKQSKINYNSADLDLVVSKIEKSLEKSKTVKDDAIQKNINHLKITIQDIKDNKTNYQKDGFYTDTINYLTYQLDNVNYVLVSKNQLNIAIEEANRITDKELSTIDTTVVKEFKAALKAANDVLYDTTAMQEQVDSAFNHLSQIMQKLSYAMSNKAELKNLIKKIETLKEKDYTASSWQAMMKILEETKTVIANESATKEDIQKAYNVLMKSFLQLRVETVDKTTLNNLIKIAEGLSKDQYETKSWAVLETAIKNAKVIMDKTSATTSEIDEVFTQLQVALNGLIKASIPDINTPSEDVTNPKTEDATNYIYIVTAGVSLIIVAYLILKKRNSKTSM